MSSIRDSLPSVLAKLKSQAPPPAGINAEGRETNDDRMSEGGGSKATE